MAASIASFANLLKIFTFQTNQRNRKVKVSVILHGFLFPTPLFNKLILIYAQDIASLVQMQIKMHYFEYDIN